jgi:hypothetical protein
LGGHIVTVAVLAIMNQDHAQKRCCSSLIRAGALIALLAPLTAASACNDEYSPFTVRAEGTLVAIDASGVSGKVVIGYIGSVDVLDGFQINVSKITLPDDQPRRIVIYEASDCAVDRASARVFNPPPAKAPGQENGNAGTIRRVDGKVRFKHFNRNADVDNEMEFQYSETFVSGLAFESAVGKIVVALAADSADGKPGVWQACAPLVAANYEQPYSR